MAPEKQNAGTIVAPDPDDIEGDSDREENEEGWEDAEPDIEEETPVLCLFCPETFAAPARLFEHCDGVHQFDFHKTRKALGKLRSSILQCEWFADWIIRAGLDFYGTIKLVNYIRASTAAACIPDFSSKSLFEDEKFLQPVLEDDALLFGLDEVVDEEEVGVKAEGGVVSDAEKVKELEVRLASLSRQFSEYKEVVNKSFEAQLVEPEKAEKNRDDDSHYFHSYAGNGTTVPWITRSGELWLTENCERNRYS